MKLLMSLGLAILGLVAAVATPQVLKYLAKAKTDTARIDIKGIGVALPTWAQTSKLVVHGAWWQLNTYDLAHSQCDVVAAVFVLGLSVLLSIGIRESAGTNVGLVVIQLVALVAFVVFLIARSFMKPVPTKSCPRCLADDLAMGATRCPHCTSDIAAARA